MAITARVDRHRRARGCQPRGWPELFFTLTVEKGKVHHEGTNSIQQTAPWRRSSLYRPHRTGLAAAGGPRGDPPSCDHTRRDEGRDLARRAGATRDDDARKLPGIPRRSKRTRGRIHDQRPAAGEHGQANRAGRDLRDDSWDGIQVSVLGYRWASVHARKATFVAPAHQAAFAADAWYVPQAGDVDSLEGCPTAVTTYGFSLLKHKTLPGTPIASPSFRLRPGRRHRPPSRRQPRSRSPRQTPWSSSAGWPPARRRPAHSLPPARASRLSRSRSTGRLPGGRFPHHCIPPVYGCV